MCGIPPLTLRGFEVLPMVPVLPVPVANGQGRRDDGETRRQEIVPRGLWNRGNECTSARRLVVLSSFHSPARGMLRRSGQDCRIGRMNRMGEMGPVNPDHPEILSNRCRGAGRRPEDQKGGALAEPSDASEFQWRQETPMCGIPPLTLRVSCVALLRRARGVLCFPGQDCRISRMNRIGGVGPVNPGDPGILSKIQGAGYGAGATERMEGRKKSAGASEAGRSTTALAPSMAAGAARRFAGAFVREARSEAVSRARTPLQR